MPRQLAVGAAQRRVARHYRIGPARRGYDDPSYVHRVEAFDGNGLRPYAPCHLRADRGPDGLTLRWIRRTRIDGDAWEAQEVPLGEEVERYVVRVTRQGALLRQAETFGPAWHYPAAERAADGAVTVEVAQLSARYGAGPAARLELDA